MRVLSVAHLCNEVAIHSISQEVENCLLGF